MAFGDAKDVSQVGKTIGNYKVVQQIGEGGMGVVYLAEHPVIGRKVAIKLLHGSFARDSETVARFFNEARAIHMIAHPNIVEILDFGQTTDGQPYFIMEFLLGQSLADRIARGPMAPVDALAIVTQICDALQAAHDKNIVHRDLKPHNVYLIGAEAKPTVKILDFGVAKMTTGWNTADSGGQSVKTRTGSLMGTPLYMSPEQCRGSGKLDHRTDIYSLAVILFEMISGHPPFMAEGVGELFAKHMLEPPPSLAEVAPRTPPQIVRAVMRALSKDLEDRYPTMRAFAEALSGRDVAMSPPGSPRPRVAASQIATFSGAHPTSAGRPPEEATTLSSAVAQLFEETQTVPKRSYKGFAVALIVGAIFAGGGVVMLRQRQDPPKIVEAAPPPPPPEPVKPPPPAEPEVVDLRFESEPDGAHILRKSADKPDGEDLGVAPMDLKLSKSDESIDYILRAQGFKDRPVSVDALRDRVLHLALDRLPVVEKKPPKAAPPRPNKPRKPAIHDADGLAVPSF
ncbi:MAG TPA: serine/threonine-protein kinase [Polyangia bacterium]|jgi:serine/threonine-protein kinase